MKSDEVQNRIADWQKQIEKNTSRYLETFGPLTAEQLNWKPNTDTWSIAQVIDHVIIINESYQPMITALQKGTYQPPFLSKLSFLNSFFGKLILGSVAVDRKKSTTTFPIWEPSNSHINDDIIEKFIQNQIGLSDTIAACGKELANDAVINSPANKIITYKLEDAFDIIVTHEERHFYQAQEILKLNSK